MVQKLSKKELKRLGHTKYKFINDVNFITAVQKRPTANDGYTGNPEGKEYNNMCKAVSENIFRHSGRVTDSFDFSREANILNIISTGSEAQSIKNNFRLRNNKLTSESLKNKQLEFLQKQDIIYMNMNLPAKERINLLISTFNIIFPESILFMPYLQAKIRNVEEEFCLKNLTNKF